MKLENFSLLYPDGQTQNDHLAGRDVPDIDMYTLQELGMLEFFNPKSVPAAEHFTTDPAVITYRNQTFADLLNNPSLVDTLHRLVPSSRTSPSCAVWRATAATTTPPPTCPA